MPRGIDELRVLLLGIEPSVAGELASTLRSLGYGIITEAESVCDLDDDDDVSRYNFIFTSSDRRCFHAAMTHAGAGVPVIITTRLPEEQLWLDAMEEGAADYCAAPFEPNLIGWILQSNGGNRKSLQCMTAA